MNSNDLIYLDNAATSWPKPPGVAGAMTRFLADSGANPGRSGHRLSADAGRVVHSCREILAQLFGLNDPLRLVFTHNVTEALNLVLRGMLKPGDHVTTSSMEHNSVMRPLRALEKRGVDLTVVPCDIEGYLDPNAVRASMRPSTRLVVVNHVSNVCGTVQPLTRLGQVAREADALLLVDAAASAGVVPIDMEQDQIDLLAFTGHKGLLGPTGTGGLAVGSRVDPAEIDPLVRGGTGSHSEHDCQPAFLPDRFESGTLNAVGLAGLEAGVRWLQQQGLDELHARQQTLLETLLSGLEGVPGLSLCGPRGTSQRGSSVSLTIDGLAPSEAGYRLDEEHGILVRVGLHCSPQAHKTLGTFPDGTVRIAPGPFTTAEELDRTRDALVDLAREAQG